MEIYNIKISGYAKESIVDGPGMRYVVFFQGCLHQCFKCHNEGTHDLNGGFFVNIEDIVKDIQSNPHLDGVTISGGEPFLQNKELLCLVKKLKSLNYHIILYSGFLYEELLENSINNEILNSSDILIDGKFIYEQKDLTLLFCGSKNQRTIDLPNSSKTNVKLHEFIN